MSEETNFPSSKKKNRKKALVIFIFILLLLALVTGLYWFFFVKGYESTDDAYVSGNQVMISSQVSGNVQQINADNMDFVRAGEQLLSLDNSDLQLAFEQAQSNLASAVRQVSQLNYTIKQLSAAVQSKTVSLEQVRGNLQRREQLNKTQSIDKESYLHAKEAVELAKVDLIATQNQLSANQALLLDVPLDQQPSVLHAVSQLKQAWLNLQRSKIVSPIDGYVARRSVQVGQKVAVGSALLAVIPVDQMWIDANFKETQLRYMRLGQPVKVKVDLYGDKVEFNGKVSGIDMGTGSAFSLLPAQNATGNWIKVVQRVPVRIALEPEQLQKYPLRIGLSSQVEVNVQQTDGDVLRTARDQTQQQTLYSTSSLVYDQTAVENLVNSIISQNTY
ncbi:EmrA/EmrK family multidrug efflux transporter periplasmic adaptor subunit [Lonepinella koalarum]|uniref:Membrane fusion protein (Multidrug efflux system) n=1 Tax=Lonepinella koalarum TaxID=53417 RepID=A0A4R1KQA3_9PAST|nr:EmrA/EmrK family multidrug efflux transporter periplasmic adaptor subunit [Lonepinella koalarum]MDH2925634.1 multidrug transporter [Lonepinella koalarum]TCK67172.1 membrane fusion protein (multidrug efflux system) [Lonepinella koalarum]TFJ89170.1 EmrA/EmrK family multidrug efflux transporter periplasmic adaptor subunit [Lonepinella koalarum]